MAKLRLFKASSFYDSYLNLFYEKSPQLLQLSYLDVKSSLFEDGFAWSDSIKRYLEKTGTFDVEEVVLNDYVQQNKWALENGFSSRKDHLLEILSAQIEEFKPDIFFAHDYAYIDAVFIQQVKIKCPSIKMVIGYDGIALMDEYRFAEHDLILTCLDFTKDYYESKGKKAFLMPYGFDNSILTKIEKTSISHQVSFVGGLNLMNGGHHKRLSVLGGVADRFNPDYFISGNSIVDTKLYKWPQRKRILSGKIKEALNVYKIGKNNRGPSFGQDMYKVFGSSMITLNVHIDLANNRAANIRLFEATGMGCCLLTDWKENISDYFIPEEEVVTFKSKSECLEKIKYLLDNPDLRKQIAEAGQKRTISCHTMEKRVNTLAKYILTQNSF